MIILHGIKTEADQSSDACVTCHTYLGGELAKPVKEWQGSIHAQNDITCDLCHGGDATVEVGDPDKLSGSEFDDRQGRAMSKSNDFIGIPSGREMFDMCGQCHDESVTSYAGSIMGRAFLGGKGGPSCVACHNGTRATGKPADHINTTNLCENCHSTTVSGIYTPFRPATPEFLVETVEI